MPYKIGGGYLLQWFDKSNGQYADAGKDSLDGAVLAHYFNVDAKGKLNSFDGLLDNTKFLYFPQYPLDKEYCTDFVEIFRCHFHTSVLSIPQEKITKYLLIHLDKDDKSEFLNKLGYDAFNWDILEQNILKGVEFKYAEFDRLTQYGLYVCAKTSLPDLKSNKIYYVDTIWKVDSNFHCRFITMIIGGKKYGNK